MRANTSVFRHYLRYALTSACAAVLLAGCWSAHVPGPYDPYIGGLHDGPPLPQGVQAKLEQADALTDKGPQVADLRRSLRCVNAILAQDPAHEGAAWRAARALYFLSEAEPQKAMRAELSGRCMDAAHVAMTSGQSAAGHYWGGLCMGARAQAKSMEAMELLPKMVEVGRTAVALDPNIEHGGPHRLLGGIFLRAPAWPTSVGDIDEALTHLEEAVKVDSSWPENHLMYAEALAADERFEEAAAELSTAQTLMKAPEMARWAEHWKEDLERVQASVARD